MATEAATFVHAPGRSRFFLGMSVLLLAISVIAFVPTLFLRPFFDVAPMPGYLYVHGYILTAWFVLLVAQAGLIGAGRPDVHRRLGAVGAVLAVVVVFGGMMAGLLKASRLHGLGVDLEARIGADSGVFWANLSSTLLFIAFVTLAVVLRRRSEAHKRLLLLASINLMGPALGRIARWTIFGGVGFNARAPLEAAFPITGMVVLLLVLIGYDLLVRRKLHPATWMGCALTVVVRIVSTAIAFSPMGQDVVRGTASF